MSSRRPLAILVVVLLMTMWGMTFLVTKVAVRELPPFTLGVARFAIGALVLAAIAGARSGRALFRRPAEFRWLFLLAFFGITLFTIGLNFGMLWGTVTQGALVFALTPAAVGIAAVTALGERLGPVRVWGIVLSVAGVLLVVAFGTSSATAPRPVLAAIAMATVVAGWAVYTVAAKRVAGADQVIVMAWASALGTLMLVPAAAWELAAHGLPTLSAQGLLGVLYLGVLASGIGYVAYNWSLLHLEASVVGALSNLDPVVGVGTAVIFLGERLVGWQLAGGLIALAGMYLASRE